MYKRQVEAIEAIQAFDHYAAMSFDRVNKEDRAYIRHVLHWQGLTAAIEQALSQTVLTDADQDFIQPVSYTHLDVYKRQLLVVPASSVAS